MSRTLHLERGTALHRKVTLGLLVAYAVTLTAGAWCQITAIHQGRDGLWLWPMAGVLLHVLAGVLLSLTLLAIYGVILTYHPRHEAPEDEDEEQVDEPR